MSMILRPVRFDGGHVIDGSGLFDGSTGYLSKTFGSAGSQTTWTWAGIIKRSLLASQQGVFSAGVDGNNFTELKFNAADQLEITHVDAGAVTDNVVTTQAFTDVSGFNSVIWVADTTNATSTDRYRLYVNGTRITSFGTTNFPSASFATDVNSTSPMYIGRRLGGTGLFDGYVARSVFIDGLALGPTSFGKITLGSLWQISDVSGLTFGTNGFLIEGSTDMVAGTDSSGNTNNFTKTGTITANTTPVGPTI